MRLRTTLRIAALAAVIAADNAYAPAIAATPGDRWQEAIAAFEDEDRQTPPRAGGIVFVGSSSIAAWDLARHFPGVAAVNRGCGGSQIGDAVAHLDVLVIRHRPRTVVMYAGDNDLADGKTPHQVVDDFKTFAAGVHAALPDTRVAYIGIKPSLQRWHLIAAVRETNSLIREYCDGDDRLGFVDVERAMLGWDARPRRELFVADGLHLSSRGYELWATLVRPFIE